MANASLPIGGSSQSQTTTQSPQGDVGSITGATKSSSVQPTIATSALTSPGSVALHATALPGINLSTVQTAAPSTAVARPTQPGHHVNATLIGLVIILFVVAAGSFLAVNRTAKDTI